MYKPQSNLEEQTIVVTDMKENDAGTQVIITDEAGNNYSFFKMKRAGGPTQAFTDLDNVSIGTTINVLYEEKPGQSGRSFRNVARLKPAGPVGASYPTTSPQVAQTTPVSRPTGLMSKPAVVSPLFNRSKMIGILALMKVAGVALEALEQRETWERFANAYDVGESVVDAPANPLAGSEIKVEDIPF